MKPFNPTDSLRHPFWWIMTALLVINDAFLKSWTAFPGIISGKLSDFTGLLVFPLLLAAIFHVKRQSRWLACHIVTAAVFCAVKLIPDAGTLYVHALRAIGIQAQLWHDPTDIIALLSLPLSFFLYPRLTPRFHPQKHAQRFKILAIATAGLACVASSGARAPRQLTTYDGNLMVSDLTLINATPDSISVSVETLNPHVKADCRAPFDPQQFKKDQFETKGTWTQNPGEAAAVLPYAIRKTSDPACKIIKLSIDNIESVLVRWDTSKIKNQDVPIQYALPVTPEQMPDNTILLHRNKKDYYMLAKGKFDFTYWQKDLFAIDYWKM